MASARESQRCILRANSTPVVVTCWTSDTAFRVSPSNAFPPCPFDDRVVEVDEMYQNAGAKGEPHRQAEDPPRRRGNQFNGHGTFDNDRPPVFGAIGRKSGEVYLNECKRSTKKVLQPIVEAVTTPGTVITPDEWPAYADLPATGRPHSTVNHREGEYARDDDGDGVREVHCNTMEGFWLGCRNFLRMFRGVHKKYLNQYVAFYACMHNFRCEVLLFLGALLGCNSS